MNATRNWPRIQFLGAPVDNLSMLEAVAVVREFISEGRPRQIVPINASKLWQMPRNPRLAAIIEASDLVVPEWAVVWGAGVLGTPLKAHIGGIMLLDTLLPVAAREGFPTYFLGAKPDVNRMLVARLTRVYPELRIAGAHHGYFTPDEESAVISSIRDARPALLFVAMGTPRQEYWISQSKSELGVPVSMGVGGSFDVLAGIKKDAPNWARGRGLEWLVRLAHDPRNLWKRYLITNPWFVYQVLRARFMRRAR